MYFGITPKIWQSVQDIVPENGKKNKAKAFRETQNAK
jgi:hypothetical protein